jgi:DNA-binding transcriptional MerR regulator
MRIGQLAAEANVNIQTLRYYERRGLLSPPERLASRYRVYSQSAVQRVRFIRRAQELGFTLQEIGDLLTLWSDSARSCEAVERRGLGRYVAECQHRPGLEGCPLLAALGGPADQTGPQST